MTYKRIELSPASKEMRKENLRNEALQSLALIELLIMSLIGDCTLKELS